MFTKKEYVFDDYDEASAFGRAVAHGHLDIMEWLPIPNTKTYTIWCYRAASSGHLHVLKWGELTCE